MECDIWGHNVENSEDLQKHKEQAHATGVGDTVERPDLVGDAPDDSAPTLIPTTSH